MLLSGGTRHQPIQLCVSTRPPYTAHSLIKADTRPAAASALPVKLSFAETRATTSESVGDRHGVTIPADTPSFSPSADVEDIYLTQNFTLDEKYFHLKAAICWFL
ncbi:hypothetical protein ABVT39_023533 [Epinephelus coioides]